jgi:hypothetical protein
MKHKKLKATGRKERACSSFNNRISNNNRDKVKTNRDQTCKIPTHNNPPYESKLYARTEEEEEIERRRSISN